MSTPELVTSGTARANQKVSELVAEFLAESRAAEPPRRVVNRPAVRRAAALCLALVCAGVWLVPYPAQASLAEPSPRLLEASARICVFLAAQRVKHFQRLHHRLPTSLSEAGVGESQLTYTFRAGGFVVAADSSSNAISYDSFTATDSLLVGAEAVIDAPPR